jgi:hypothetical protein
VRVGECDGRDAVAPMTGSGSSRSRRGALGSSAAAWQGAGDDALELPGDLGGSLRSDRASNRAAAEAAVSVLTAEAFAGAVADSLTSRPPGRGAARERNTSRPVATLRRAQAP